MAKFWKQAWDKITGQPDLSDYWDREVQAKREAAWAADDKQAADTRELNRKAPKAPRKGRTSKFTPDTQIQQLAYNAANWLADHHSKEVKKVGRPVFLAQRVNEILAGIFPEQFWEPCPMVEEQTMKALPTIDYNAPQPPEKFITPGSKNTVCKYTTCTPDTGNASNAGYTNPYGFFVDLFSKQKNYKFEIPKPLWSVPRRPLFSRHKATWDVAYSHDNRQSFSNLYKASLAASADAFRLESEAVDQRGRFYYWHKKCPPLDPATLRAHMERSFVVDANYNAWDDGYDDNAGGFALIQVAPAPPRGTYRYLSLSVFVDQSNEIALFVGKPDDEHDPACGPYVPTISDWAYTTNPQYDNPPSPNVGDWCKFAWYYNQPAFCDATGYCIPENDPRRKVSALPLRGNQTGRHRTFSMVPYSPRGWDVNPKVGAPGTIPLDGVRSGTYVNTPVGVRCSAAYSYPPHDAYEGWGYTAYNSCTKAYVTHVFPGPRPAPAQFSADWLSGKYPL